jgi:DNA-binding NtrC family response regulator
LVQIGDAAERLVARSEAARTCIAQLEALARSRGPVVLVGEGGSGRSTFASFLHEVWQDQEPSKYEIVRGPKATRKLDVLSDHAYGRVKDRRIIVLDDFVDELAEAVENLLFHIRNRGQRWRVMVIAKDKPAMSRNWSAIVNVPPLRQRRADIVQLARRLILRCCRELGLGRVGLTGAALDLLEAHAWPGNIRELHEVLERALLLRDDLDLIDVDELPAALKPPPGFDVDRTLDEVVRRHVLGVLGHYAGNRLAASRQLGVSRNTLKRWLDRWGGAAGSTVAPGEGEV